MLFIFVGTDAAVKYLRGSAPTRQNTPHRFDQIYEWLICEKILEYNLIKDTTMKIKLLASSIVMAGALMASESASAGLWTWSGTQSDWVSNGTIVDSNPPLPAFGISSAPVSGDGDTAFTLISVTSFTPAAFTLSENDSTGKDLYSVGTIIAGGTSTGTFIYSVTTTDPFGFNIANLDTTTTSGIGNVTTNIYSDAGLTTLIASFNSINSVSSPYANFSGYSTLYVQDIINSGSVTGLNNSTSYIAAPEPMTLSMMGLGFAAFGYSRRRKAA